MNAHLSRNASMALFAIALLAGVAVGAPAPLAGATTQAAGATTLRQPGAAEDAGPKLEFVSQSPWVGSEESFVLRVGIEAPGPAALEVTVRVLPAVAFRSEFQQTLEGRLFGRAVLPDAVFPIDAGGADVSGVYQVDVPADLGGRDGVHPVLVELRDRESREALDDFVTHLVYLPGDPAERTAPKLGVSFVLPLHALPALQPDGTRRAPPRRQLEELPDALEMARPLSVTYAPTPETVASMVEGAEQGAGSALTALRAAVDGRTLVGGTHVPVSLPALANAGLPGEIARQLARGRTTLSTLLRADPATHLWVTQEPLDAASIDLLANGGVTRVLTQEDSLTPIPDQLLTLAAPFTLEGEQATVEGAVADPGLTAHFDDTGNDALQAAHLLADLAVLYLDLPGVRRGVVAMPPQDWVPSAAFLESLASGLGDNPAVQAMSLDELFSTVPPASQLGRPLVRRPLIHEGSGLNDAAPDIVSTRSRLNALDSVLGETNALSADLDERLLVAQSADFDSAQRRDRYLDGVLASMSEQLDGIMMPQDSSITLTAREGEIPVTFQNRTGIPARLVVRLKSDKLDFPAGETVEIDLTRLNTTHRFPVVARTSGTFPIRITLESPDGGMVVSRARLTVRSTAASGVGLAISVGAALFLVLWWGRHIMRGRHGDTAEANEGGGSDGEGGESTAIGAPSGGPGVPDGATVRDEAELSTPPPAGSVAPARAPDEHQDESRSAPAPGPLGGG